MKGTQMDGIDSSTQDVRIEVRKDGRVYTVTRDAIESDNPTMLRRALRGAAAEMDQVIAGVVELDDA